MVRECNIVAVILRSTLDMFFFLSRCIWVVQPQRQPTKSHRREFVVYSCVSRQSYGTWEFPIGRVLGLKVSLGIIKCREKYEGVRVKTW